MTPEQAILPGLLLPKRQAGGSFVLQRETAKAEREDNKLKLGDRAAHQWYRFVLSFPPHLVREYVAKFGLDSHHQVSRSVLRHRNDSGRVPKARHSRRWVGTEPGGLFRQPNEAPVEHRPAKTYCGMP